MHPFKNSHIKNFFFNINLNVYAGFSETDLTEELLTEAVNAEYQHESWVVQSQVGALDWGVKVPFPPRGPEWISLVWYSLDH